MAAHKTYVAFDLGASSGRGVVGMLDDQHLQIEELHRFPNGPISLVDAMYWDVLRLFSETTDALTLYGQRYGKDLHGIGFDTWGVDYGLLAKDGSLLGTPVHYRDNRTDGMMEEACNRVGRETIFNATGVQFIQLNTLYQIFSMVVNQSPLLEIADTLLMMPSLLMYFYTGRKVNEFTHVTTTQMYDPRTGEWAHDLLQQLDIPTGILDAEIVPPGTVIGDIRPDIAGMVGLRNVPVIASATHDTGAAVAAVPAEGEDWAYLSSGTWSLLGLEIHDPIITADSLRYNVTNEGGVGNTYRFLKNIAGLWLVQECKRLWERDSGVALDYADLIEAAKAARPFVTLFDPNAADFLNPADMPAAIAQHCQKIGQDAPTTRGEFVRCSLESLAMKYRNVLEKCEELRGKPVETLHIVGGGVQNTLLCQFAANATGKRVVAGPVEATAIGNIMMQAIATGDIGSIAEGREIVKRSFDVITYEPQDTAHWDEVYQRVRPQLEQSW
jgi:rhamnulokinase